MGVKKWESVLELNKPKSKLNDDDRVNLITQHIEKLSLDNCYHTPSKKKDCACLSFFQGDEVAQKCIALYILYWAKKSPMEQKMVLIWKIKSHFTHELMIAAQMCIALYILYWAKKSPMEQKMVLIEKMKSANPFCHFV